MVIILIHQEVSRRLKKKAPRNNVIRNNSTLLKYKSNIKGVTEADGADRKVTNTKIAVPLKYLRNF